MKADIQGHLGDSWVRVEHQCKHLSLSMFLFFFFGLSNVIFTQSLMCLLREIVKIIKLKIHATIFFCFVIIT